MHIRRHHIPFRSDRGQTAVEFAMVAPLLIALLLGIVQIGIAFHNYIAITDAARAAARQAITARIQGLSAATVTSTAANAAPDLDPKKLSVTFNPANPASAAAGSTVSVTVTYPYEINIFGVVVCKKCNVTSTVSEQVE